MPDDLISRAAACECIGKMIHEYREKGEYPLADGMILARRYGIKRLPAVDAVPVVRCKDCKHWTQEDDDSPDWVCNKFSIGDSLMYTAPEWYCADGERRDEDG